MKNKLKNIFLAFIFALSLPAMMFLSACGATPSSEVTGICFHSMKYDDDGVAIFEVDKDISTNLTYKVFPSSASGYRAYFDPLDKGTAENSLRFTFKDGNITVNSNSFEDVRYKVRVGEFSDTCIIRLKEYPKEIYTDEPSVILNNDEICDIVIKANFADGRSGVKISDSDYNFLVESEDETIVSVPNKNRLKFIAVRKTGTASTKVTATILNSLGEKTGLKIEIQVKVVQNVSYCKVVMSGYDLFVENKDSIEIDYNKLAPEGEKKLINIDIYPFNTNGELCVEDNYIISLSKENNYVICSEDRKNLLVSESVPNGYNVKVKIYFPDLKLKNPETGQISAFVMAIDLTIVK